MIASAFQSASRRRRIGTKITQRFERRAGQHVSTHTPDPVAHQAA
jgi:hypothetical protein